MLAATAAAEAAATAAAAAAAAAAARVAFPTTGPPELLATLQLVGAADFAAADDAGHTARLKFARGVLLLLQVGDPLGDLPSTWDEIVATLDAPVAPPDLETGRLRMTRLLPPAVLLVQGWMAGVGMAAFPDAKAAAQSLRRGLLQGGPACITVSCL